jgi:hypothetical protein
MKWFSHFEHKPGAKAKHFKEQSLHTTMLWFETRDLKACEPRTRINTVLMGHLKSLTPH